MRSRSKGAADHRGIAIEDIRDDRLASGIRLGAGANRHAMQKLQSQSTSNPTSIVQKAAVAALSGSQDCVKQMLAGYIRLRDKVVAGLRSIPGITCATPNGAFYAYPNVSHYFDDTGLNSARTSLTDCCMRRTLSSFPAKASVRRIMFASPMRPRLRIWIAVWIVCATFSPAFSPCRNFIHFWWSPSSMNGPGESAICGRFIPESSNQPIGESWLTWEDNRVANGPLAGQSLGDLSKKFGRDLVGQAAVYKNRFPLLVKFLFPGDKLSVQVHPDDEQARKKGQPCGKTECWYVLRANPGAQVALGLKAERSSRISSGDRKHSCREVAELGGCLRWRHAVCSCRNGAHHWRRNGTGGDAADVGHYISSL